MKKKADGKPESILVLNYFSFNISSFRVLSHILKQRLAKQLCFMSNHRRRKHIKSVFNHGMVLVYMNLKACLLATDYLVFRGINTASTATL